MPGAAREQDKGPRGDAFTPVMTEHAQHDADNAKDSVNGSFTGPAAWRVALPKGDYEPCRK